MEFAKTMMCGWSLVIMLQIIGCKRGIGGGASEMRMDLSRLSQYTEGTDRHHASMQLQHMEQSKELNDDADICASWAISGSQDWTQRCPKLPPYFFIPLPLTFSYTQHPFFIAMQWPIHIEAEARLIIRLVFGFASHSVFVKLTQNYKILRWQCCLVAIIHWPTISQPISTQNKFNF